MSQHTTHSPSPGLKAELMAFAHRLALTARSITLPLFRKRVAVDNKLSDGAFDPVTEADKNAEQALRALIEQHYPTHDIMGEEYGSTDKGSDFCWVLDPVDGTRAFISGLPSWGTLIALTYHGMPLIGVIDQPVVNECYMGDGEISTLNGKPMRTSPCATLADAMISTTDPYLFDGASYAAFTMLRQQCKLIRYGLDCYAYAILASGHLHMVVEKGLAPHDRMALIPVIRGAGGLALDWRGRPAGPSDEMMALSDPRLQEHVLPMFAVAAGP